jgi:transposase
MAAALAAASVRMLRPSPSFVDGLHNGTSPPARGRSTKKNGGDQALGRSRGGLSTKIHAATIDENCSVALHLTAGHAHDGRQFETLYESLDPDNVLESATMDKAYDADRIRERLSYDGVQAVIPPIPTRARKLPYDHSRYRERNCIERFFNKVKHFRRIATRYDKLAKTFFAALCIVSAFILIRNS